MKKEEALKYLGSLFVVRDEKEEPKVLCFRSEYMNKENPAYPIYEAVSDAMYDSWLTHSFSYQIASPAVDILTEVEDWEDEDALREQIDSYTPIYNGEITEIYSDNSWAVDEARQEFGSQDSIQDAQMAWYQQIEQMVSAIKSKLEDLIDED